MSLTKNVAPIVNAGHIREFAADLYDALRRVRPEILHASAHERVSAAMVAMFPEVDPAGIVHEVNVVCVARWHAQVRAEVRREEDEAIGIVSA